MVFTRGDLWPSHHEALCVLTWLVCWVHQLAQRCTWMWAAGTCRAHRDAEAAGDVGARIFGTGQRRRQGDRPRISTVLAGFQRS